MQSRLDSFVEAMIGMVIGFVINFVANLLILPAFGFTSLTAGTNFIIGLVYTFISVARTYAVRRWAQQHLTRLRQRIVSAIRRRLT